ncbi:uncharacterized protein B0H18DRAFT_1161603 [Fomitopsis serialis]|uniref:uncharacterized protein n=1 Tax=Fomitopsis serialis TaxID=139415 RepID=UPI002007452A|nr:uncharacterized protein B0H18DRAFT_1161603 [Neoantrodia serialis]KAH9927288.1 hypothetical protein B0H18DRAFT_1161603 [Neoantrodia serialis]
MPARRASAAAQNIASAASRVHKSNGSNHSMSGPSSLAPSSSNAPYSSSSIPITPQQKVVYVLVNRLKSKLPCNSGITLTDVEGDEALQQVIESLVELSRDSLDIIGWALTELLEKLNKQADSNGYRSVEVLQSQLFILKVLAICMASRWGRRPEGTRPGSRNSKEPASVNSKPSTPETRTLSSQSRRRQWSTEHLSLLAEPPPLDDNCAKYILSVMVLLLRQTAPLRNRLMSAANMDFAASHHDFESVESPDFISSVDVGGSGLPPHIISLPRMFRSRHASSTSLNSGTPSVTSTSQASKYSLVYEKTSVVTSKSISSLNTLISKFAGRVVYHLSASNWHIVLSRIRNKIHYLASTTETDPDIIDLQLMMHSALDRARLIQALQELSSLLLNMKQEAQAAIAIPLRVAIWNWIDLCPEEFNDTIRHHRRMEGAPERVFDILFDSQEAQHKPNVWPTLTALACISSERTRADFQSNSLGMPIPKGNQSRRDRNFYEIMMRNMTSQTAKLSEEALVCCLDTCRAAFRIRPEDNAEHALHMTAHDLAHELKRILASWNGSKPFWEFPDEIDVAIVADILVTIFRYLSEEEVTPIFQLCLEPERSDAVKISAIKACITLIDEASKCPWQPPLDSLRDAVSERFALILAASLTRRSEVDPLGNIKKPALRPKAKRYTSETLPDRELLAYSLLALFRADPMLYINGLDVSQESKWTKVCVECWHAPGDPAIKMSLAKTFRSWVDMLVRLPPEHPRHQVGCIWLATVSPAILATVCTNLLLARTDLQAQRMWINMAYEIIYRFTKSSETEKIRRIQINTDRIPAFAVAEIAFLVALTSADTNVTLTAAHCLRLLAQAETAPDAPASNALNEDERAKRYPIYEQLAIRKSSCVTSNVYVGRIGHQKRVRRLMRLMPSTSPVHVAVWEECYWRWCALNEMVIKGSIDSTVDVDPGIAPVGEKALTNEEIHAQWQNLTLFLASFGSACLRDDESSDVTLDVAPFFLPDEMRILRNPAELLSSFLGGLIDFLVSDSIQTRDAARDALGSEASPRLFTKIFKELDSVVRELAASETVDWDSLALFLEQFLVILKVLVENDQYLEEIRSMDLGSTLAVIASFMGRFHDLNSYRLRLKFCSLCEGVFSQGESIAMRKDSSNRQKIADIVTEWIQDPALSDHSFAAQQRELNLLAFRAAVKLFDRLELQAADGTTGEEAAHVVSRMFVRYTGVLFKAWECSRYDMAPTDDRSTDKSAVPGLRSLQRDGELRELVITGYAALVSANPDVGVKHSLPLAYEVDSARRVIFSYVFTRVLPQGISLDSQEQPTVVPRQSRLCELVKGPDLSLALAICEVCPASEVDSLISVMLNLFDTRSALMTLLKNMIDLEVSRTDSDTALFRGNTTCTRFLSAFANIYGYNYLRSLIIPLIKTMTSMPPGHGYELDPAKVGEEIATANRETIQFITSSFLQIILSSIPAVPPMLREVCAHIARLCNNEVWPEAKFAAVGAFMFLRFISPAIVAPEIIDVDVPKEDWALRRGLMLVAKIIQNLANNIFFGKEPHMIALNDFLKENIVNVTRFLSDLNKTGPAFQEEEPEEWLDTTYDDTDTIVLHRFLEKHADRVGKELLSTSKPPPTTEKLSATATAEMAAAHAKRIWDSLCAALVELGQPLEGPRLTVADSQQHSEYLDLMTRYEYRDTSSVQGLFVETPTPTSSKAIFVLAVSRIDVEILDIELLLFYIFKTVASSSHGDRDFDIIFDFTCFTLASQLPLQWLKFAYEVIPSDIRRRFDTAHILTPNQLATKYLKRLYNLSSGIEFSSECATYSSVEELIDHLPDGTSLAALDYALALESEPRTRFDEVTMRHTHPMRVPVSLEVAQGHLRITTLKALPIGGTMSCRATDIIALSDVNDIYNVSTGHETHEFIIRKIRHGATLYFSSHARDNIVKAIRTAKSTMRSVQLPGTERRSRFSNVVATLLHVGMLGVNSREEDVRIAANELLQAVCIYLDFEGKPLVASKSSLVNGLPEPFLVQLSEGLATFAPHLTLDFVTEISTSMGRESIPDRILCIQYMAPWLRNLAYFMDPTSKHYDPSTTKFRDCVRVLVDLTMADNELHNMVLKYIWAEIGRLDSPVVNAVLDELMRAAVDGGVASVRCERVADTMSAITSINVRGRILSRLRKVVGKTSTKPTKSLADNVHWNEISCLVRLALVAGHHCKNVVQSQLFVPETVHLVTLTAATGQTYVRTAVYGIVVNLLNALYTARLADTAASPDIQQLINECEQPETLRLFGLLRPTPTSDYVNLDPPSDKLYVDTMESLVRFLSRVLETIAGSKGLLNVWRARWMSLITSSAFQLSPAVQTRAFVALGVLATSDVDDDLLYQMLVAFKTALSQSSENETTSVVSMLRCIRNVVPALPRYSRYLCQLFWLAVALLQSSHMVLYVEAIHLLRETVEVMDSQGAFEEKGVSATLLDGRAALEDVACQLDQLLGLSFESNFSFSLAAVIFKGIRHANLRDPAEAALRTLMKTTVRSCGEVEHADDGPGSPMCQQILGYFLALIPTSTTTTTFKRLLEESGVDSSWLSDSLMTASSDDDPVFKVPFALLGLSDVNTVLFVTSFVGAIMQTAQGDDTESQMFCNLLSDIADAFPDVVSMAYESLQDRIKEAFANSASPAILCAVSNLFRVAVHDAGSNGTAPGSASSLSIEDGLPHGPGRSHLFALEEQGMQGLANSFQFLPPNQGHATKMMNWISELVMKIIE